MSLLFFDPESDDAYNVRKHGLDDGTGRKEITYVAFVPFPSVVLDGDDRQYLISRHDIQRRLETMENERPSLSPLLPCGRVDCRACRSERRYLRSLAKSMTFGLRWSSGADARFAQRVFNRIANGGASS